MFVRPFADALPAAVKHAAEVLGADESEILYSKCKKEKGSQSAKCPLCSKMKILPYFISCGEWRGKRMCRGCYKKVIHIPRKLCKQHLSAVVEPQADQSL